MKLIKTFDFLNVLFIYYLYLYKQLPNEHFYLFKF